MASLSAYNVVLLFANLAKTTLAGAITNTATAAALSTGSGVLYPNPFAGQGYVGTFIDAATGLLNEIVLVTGMSGDTITLMTRAQESTTALAWNAGDFFYMFNTGGSLASMLQQQQASPARSVTSSSSFTLSNLDGAILFNRTTGLAAMNVTMPVTPINGQKIRLSDGVGGATGFNPYPVTVIPNGGQSIAGLGGNAVLNVNRGSWTFEFYSTGVGTGIWDMAGPT